MADIRCPICDRPNDANDERCWYCQAELHPNKPSTNNENVQEDWLSSLRDPPAVSPADAAPDTPEPAPDSGQSEVPEWLARIRSREQAEHEDADPSATEDSVPTPVQPAGSEFPDWLTSIVPEEGQGKTDASGPAAANTGNGNEEEGDDWLKKLESWQPDQNYAAHHFRGGGPGNQAEENETASPNETSADTPADVSENQAAVNEREEWQKQFEAWTPNEEPSLPQPPPAAEPPTPTAETTPDWLDAFKQDLNVPPEPAKEETPSDETAGTSAAFLADEDTRELTGESVSPETASAAPAQEADDGNWLSAFKGLQPDEDLAGQVLPAAGENEQTKAPFDSSEINSFLGDAAPNATPPAEKPGPALEPAALPAWIKALSPKQKSGATPALAHEPLRPADSRGPLAGIEGTLPGEELSQYYTRPQTFSGAVKVSEGQQQRTLTLKNIVDQAHWVDDGLPAKTISTSWIFRALVSAALLLAVLLPLLFKGLPSIPPSLYPGEVIKTMNTVNALPVDKPVLVAADFDGSLYGELNWAMRPLFSQLMGRNIPIAYLSTNSAGTSLFRQALQPLVSQYPAYSAADHLVNLGYLPGGSTGMQSLIADPVTAMPLDVDSKPVWGSAPLKNISRLSDFGALIVISENADTARYWIEQVQPGLGITPMLVVISAQSAPLLQPYYDSGQLNGYLSGLYSAAAYETLEKSPQNASGHLASFQISMILTALLIFVGGIVSLVLFKPQTRKQQGKQR
jgi:hypothetical protein